MKKTICTGLLLLCTHVLFAQHDSQISQYVFNQVLINPAYAGSTNMMEASMLQRTQYMGFKGAPTTWRLAVASPFRLLDADHGAAFTMMSDKIGYFDKMDFNFSYAYWFDLKDQSAKLGVGISLGGTSYKISPPADWAGLNDEAIPTQAESSSVGFDMGLGVYYKHESYFGSLSCLHLNQPKVLKLESGGKALQVDRTFYLSGGYTWQTTEEFEVQPTGLLMVSTFTRPQFGLGVNVYYMQKYNVGLAYRVMDAITVSFGLAIDESFRFGAAYEYPLSKLLGSNGGTFEVFANYAFEIKLPKRKEKRYKSIRFL
ncbi:MAG: PorP/SprF family type IX secretion system membrane protein [Prevotellaceae bacterium]|nr:PorP/SprF family type IX secretion system membrane protein [Prevotellaceae bacterium]